jgi:hypothetical protein
MLAMQKINQNVLLQIKKLLLLLRKLLLSRATRDDCKRDRVKWVDTVHLWGG